MISIAALGSYVIQIQASISKRQELSIDTKTALYTAEAGLAEAAFQISQGRSGEIGSPESPASFNKHRYWVEAEKTPAGQVSLTSTAVAGRSKFRVNMLVTPNVNPVSKLGIFGDEGVHIGDRVVIDGYVSQEGTYDSQRDKSLAVLATSSGAVVGSNGDIVVDNGVLSSDPFILATHKTLELTPSKSNVNSLYSDAATGLLHRYKSAVEGTWFESTRVVGTISPGADGFVLSNEPVEGASIKPRTKGVILPEVVLPEGLDRKSDLIVESGRVTKIKERTIEMDTVRVKAGGDLRLVGPLVFRMKKLIIEPGGYLRVYDQKGPVTFYCSEGLELMDGSEISSYDESLNRHGTYIFVARPEDPADDERVVFDAWGDFRGVVYAPGDRIKIKPNMRIWGSVVAKHVTLEDGAWVSYDASLETGGVGFPALPKRTLWQALPTTDPSVMAAMSMAAMSDAAPAASVLPETIVGVIYMKHNDQRATFAGSLSSFDVSQAERIISVRWRGKDGTWSDWIQPAGASPDKVIERWREQLREARLKESLLEGEVVPPPGTPGLGESVGSETPSGAPGGG